MADTAPAPLATPAPLAALPAKPGPARKPVASVPQPPASGATGPDKPPLLQRPRRTLTLTEE